MRSLAYLSLVIAIVASVTLAGEGTDRSHREAAPARAGGCPNVPHFGSHRTGCPYLGGLIERSEETGCPYRDGSMSGSTGCPYLDGRAEDSEETGCPYLDGVMKEPSGCPYLDGLLKGATPYREETPDHSREVRKSI